MRKQELIHLHAFFEEVRRYCQREEDLSIDSSAYESLGVKTTSIHRSKAAHREAVITLSEAITDELIDEPTAVPSVTTD